MGRVGQFFTGVKSFTGEVHVELSKCTWPTRPELLESTVVVVVSCLMLAAFVGISDMVTMFLLNVVIR